MAIGEVRCGVIMTSKQRSGWPEMEQQRQRRAEQEGKRRQQRQPVDRLQRLTLNTRTSEAMMNAPATSPVM